LLPQALSDCDQSVPWWSVGAVAQCNLGVLFFGFLYYYYECCRIISLIKDKACHNATSTGTAITKNTRLSCPRQLSRMRASNCVKRLGSPPLCPRFTVLLAQAILYLCRILYRVRLCPSPRTRRVCSLRRCDANHGLPVLDCFFDMPAWGHPKNKVDRPSSLTTRHR
jgi:hypothetical protein